MTLSWPPRPASLPAPIPTVDPADLACRLPTDTARGVTPGDRPSTDALMVVTARPERVFADGRGSWLWDTEGRRLLDLVQGWAVNTLGHAPEAITDALARQSRRLLQPGPGLHNEPAARLATRLAALSGLERVFFTSSGAEANEGAIKLARKYGQRRRGGAHEIITFEQAFHGRTLATMSASGKPGFDRLFAPQVPGFPKARLNDLASVEALVGPATVAVMLEPVQGEAGVIEARADFLQALRRLCDRHGLLLIYDEVQTGVGRTGRLWGHDESGVAPDVMTLGKGLGGGVPIGALLARDTVTCFEPGDQGGTYCGNALMCAVAGAVLDAVTAPGFLDSVQARGRRLRSGLERLAARQPGAAVHGRGLLLALSMPGPDDATRLAAELFEPRDPQAVAVLVNPVRPQRLRFVPALTITDDEIDLALQRLGEAAGTLGLTG